MNDRSFAFAPLAFIRSAFCPLEFEARKLGQHPQFTSLPNRDEALALLEVGESLIYPRQFPYTDPNKHRKIGTQIVTAPFGLAPVDFDMFLGLFDYLKRHPEEIGEDRTVRITAYFIGKIAGLPTTSTDNINRIRSRVFRFSYVKYTNTAAWNSAAKQYEDLSNFEFFSIDSMSRMTESRRPIVLRLSDAFIRMLRETPCLAYCQDWHRRYSSALGRLYLIANRDGWRHAHSTIFDADMFCVHQLGFAADSDPKKDRTRRRDRLSKLRRLLVRAEKEGLIRPYKPWAAYLTTLDRGLLKGQLALRWSRGPALRTKKDGHRRSTTEDDALYDQVGQLRDQQGQPILSSVYQRLLSQYGRQCLQRHVDVVLAQKDVRPGTFTKSEIAVFINRVQHNHPPPAWYEDYTKAKDLAGFENIQPTQSTQNLYDLLSQSA